MSAFRAMLDIVIGLILVGVVFDQITTTNSNTNTPTAVKPLIILLGTLFVLGLFYDAAVQFGMVEPIRIGRRK